MTEVSCRVFDHLVKDLKKRGEDPHQLVAGVDSVSFATITNSRERVEWSTYCAVMHNADKFFSTEDFARLGSEFFFLPVIRPFSLVARLLFTTRDFYRWICKERAEGMGTQLFSCIQPRIVTEGQNHVLIRVTLPDGYEVNPAWYHISRGSLESAPRLFAQPAAKVELRFVERGGEFSIQIPPGESVFGKMKRLLAAPFAARQVAHELDAANEELVQRFAQIERAKRALETAQAISRTVHGSLDLDRTLAVIAEALVKEARFRAVRVSVDRGPASKSREAGEIPEHVDSTVRLLETRGGSLGEIHVWPPEQMDDAERDELLQYVVPVVAMALEEALGLQEILDYRANLEKKVELRTEELSAARDDLSRTVDALKAAQNTRDRIFANINHEIRTPLTLIALAAAQLGEKNPELDTRSRDNISGIDANVRRLLHLVDGLLLLAASDERQLTVRRGSCDLKAVFDRVVVSFRVSAESAGVAFEAASPGVCTLRADEAALERVFANLLSNAIKFTPSGGQVSVALEDRESEAVISVSDTGVGIDDDFKKRLFQRFEQGARPVRSGEPGSGIGLSIVKELVELQGGQVQVESEVGQGTTFRVVMPKLPATGDVEVTTGTGSLLERREIGAAPSSGPVPEMLQPAGDALATIVVAEDEPELLRQIGEILARRYRVYLAPNGDAALELTRLHHPDALVSDVDMPGMDGLELTKRFREETGNRLAPVLLVTAYGALGTRLSGFAAGAVDYILKPFHPAELMTRVEAQLAQRDRAIMLQETEKLASLGSLSAALAHEFRNPANAVINALSPLREFLPEDCLEKGSPTEELLEILELGAEQLSMLSHQLLGLVGGGALSTTPSTVQELFDRARALESDQNPKAELKLSGDSHLEIDCAASLLTQAFVNLIDNGAQAAGEGGSVRLNCREDGEEVIVDFSDSGPGVEPASARKIFEPFFSTKGPDVGTGLGLPTARRIVERHGGRLTLVDTGEGSVFRMALPKRAAEATEPAEVRPAESRA